MYANFYLSIVSLIFKKNINNLLVSKLWWILVAWYFEILRILRFHRNLFIPGGVRKKKKFKIKQRSFVFGGGRIIKCFNLFEKVFIFFLRIKFYTNLFFKTIVQLYTYISKSCHNLIIIADFFKGITVNLG
jgi:hypothetical protein